MAMSENELFWCTFIGLFAEAAKLNKLILNPTEDNLSEIVWYKNF